MITQTGKKPTPAPMAAPSLDERIRKIILKIEAEEKQVGN